MDTTLIPHKNVSTAPDDGRANGTIPKRANARRRWIGWDRRLGALKVHLSRTSGWRLTVQGLFLLVSLAMGAQFARFVHAAKTATGGALPVRPPGVEGYLPISGLMGALDWIYQGTLNNIHPAATVLFLLFVLLSLLFRKSFCSWICPVGFLSEWLGRLGLGFTRRIVRVPRWLDIPLRALKYLLLAFFVRAIFSMSPESLNAFIQSPYNKVSDVKMLEFFTDLSQTGAIILLVLALLSVVVHSFWCRYLCPYGALMGLFSWMSPVRVRRDPVTCTDCGLCDKVCPARLPVSVKPNIRTPECIGCGDCVTTCPVSTALYIGTKKRAISPSIYAVAIVAVFLIGYAAARATGAWHSSLTDGEIRHHVSNMNSPQYTHPGR